MTPFVSAFGRDTFPVPGKDRGIALLLHQRRRCIRFTQVQIARPRHGPRKGLPGTITVNVVDAREVDPPATGGVHWRLLTTHAVEDVEDALEMVGLYRRRWCIEQVFRILKTKGFDIEALRIGEPDVRFKLVTATLVAAISIQQLVHARDGDTSGGPLRPITDVLDPDDIPLMEAFCSDLDHRRVLERQHMASPRSAAPVLADCGILGLRPGSADGPGITEQPRQPSSCSKAGSDRPEPLGRGAQTPRTHST